MNLLKEPCQERRGIDYAVAIFYGNSGKDHQRLFDEILALCEDIAPGWSFEKRGSSPHFEIVISNDLGIRIELTPPDSIGERNRGAICLSIPGTCWWMQTSEQAALNFWRISLIDGFKWFTRIDFQNTELEPEWPALRMLEAANNQEIWVKGSTRFRDYIERDSEMEPINGCTLYWASSRSEKIPKSYDKAADTGWKTPAIRDEVLTRGRWANEHGRMLVMDLGKAHGSAEMVEVVNRHTESALNQHLLYFTLNGTSPKTDKNWKRKANPADWYIKRIGKHSAPIQKAPKAGIDLETTVDYGVQQYGRHMYRWVIEMGRKHDLPTEFVLNSLFMRMQSRLKSEDMEWLCDGLTLEERSEFERQLERTKDEVSRAQETGWWELRESPLTNRDAPYSRVLERSAEIDCAAGEVGVRRPFELEDAPKRA